MSANQAELREVQRKHSAYKKIMAGEIRLGNTAKAAAMEKEFNFLTNRMRVLERELIREEEDAKIAAEKAAKEAEKKKTAKKDGAKEYETIMSQVRDVEVGLSDIRVALEKEKDEAKKSSIFAEQSKLKKLWSKLVMAAKNARDGDK